MGFLERGGQLVAMCLCPPAFVTCALSRCVFSKMLTREELSIRSQKTNPRQLKHIFKNPGSGCKIMKRGSAWKSNPRVLNLAVVPSLQNQTAEEHLLCDKPCATLRKQDNHLVYTNPLCMISGPALRLSGPYSLKQGVGK